MRATLAFAELLGAEPGLLLGLRSTDGSLAVRLAPPSAAAGASGAALDVKLDIRRR